MVQTVQFAAVATMLKSATTPVDVFGSDARSERELKTAYRKLVRVVHPDRVEAAYQSEAKDLVAKLNLFYESALNALHSGTSAAHYPTSDLSFDTRLGRHVVTQTLSEFADMTALYRATTTLHCGERLETVLKIAQVPKDNELLRSEAAVLRLLAAGNKEHRAFYPELVDSFQIARGRQRLAVNSLKFMEGFMNLSEVKQRRPVGLYLLDAAWIWRRLLWALGGAHEQGVVHGAVLPQNVLIHPKLHGVVLADWCYSVRVSGDDYPPLQAVMGSRRSWYPLKVFAREPASPEVDAVLAARTLVWLLGGDPTSMTIPDHVPAVMQRYLLGITRGQPGAAYELLQQFDDVLESLGAPYYPRRFRELTL